MRNLKKFLALALAMMMAFSLMITVNAADVKTDAPVADEYQTAVNFLFELGVLKGSGDDGLYHPASTITRAEFAMMLFRLNTGITDDAKTAAYAKYANFPDVPSNHWAIGAIGYCQEYNLMQGDDNGRFNPNDEIDGYSVLITLLRVLGYDQKNELSGAQWSNQALYWASRSGMLNNLISTAVLNKAVTRETVAELFFTTLTELSLVVYKDNDYQGQVGLGNERPYGELVFDMTVYKIGTDGTWPQAQAKYDLDDDYFRRPNPDKVLAIKGVAVATEYKQAIVTFDSKMEEGAAEKELRAKGITKAASNVQVWQNGFRQPSYEDALKLGSNISAYKISEKDASASSIDQTVLSYLTSEANQEVEVYVNKDTNEIEKVICVTTFSSKLTENDIYHPVGLIDGYITLTDNWTSAGKNNQNASDSNVTANSSGTTFETEAFEAGDVVLYTRGTDPNKRQGATEGEIIIASAKKVTNKVSGTVSLVTTSVDGTVTYTLNGAKYVLSDICQRNDDGKKGIANVKAGKTATLWIDDGFVVYGEGEVAADTSTFGVIVGASITVQGGKFSDDDSHNRAGTATVKLKVVTAAGKIEEYVLSTSKVSEADCVTSGAIPVGGELTLSDGTKVKKAGKFCTPGSIEASESSAHVATVGDLYFTITDEATTGKTRYVLAATAGDVINDDTLGYKLGALLMDNLKSVPGAAEGNLIFNYTAKDGKISGITMMKKPANTVDKDKSGGNYLSTAKSPITDKSSNVIVEATGGSTPTVTAALNSDTVYIFYNATKGEIQKVVSGNTSMTMDITKDAITGVVVGATRRGNEMLYSARYVFVDVVKYTGSTTSTSSTYAYLTGASSTDGTNTIYAAKTTSGVDIELTDVDDEKYNEAGVYAYSSGKLGDKVSSAPSGTYKKGTTSTSIWIGTQWYTINGETNVVDASEFGAKLEDGCQVTAVYDSAAEIVTTIFVTKAKG